jgi:uncharacterized sporulation protein YeaH/YhbH (DUF444 family)
MPNFIDRRLNPKDKSLNNRQRFLRRARAELKRIVNEKISTEKISDIDAGHSVPLPIGGTSEPSFAPDRGSGQRKYVLPGNKDFVPSRGKVAAPAPAREGRRISIWRTISASC